MAISVATVQIDFLRLILMDETQFQKSNAGWLR